jgi:DNA-directed RNA polymerase specialized sigma24 family protein
MKVQRSAAEFAGRRRAQVKRQTAAELRKARPADQGFARSDQQATDLSLAQLSPEQRMVFECLQEETAGLTKRQISLRVACPAPAVDEALGSLISLNLVGRLNTLVPSYICKRSTPLQM